MESGYSPNKSLKWKFVICVARFHNADSLTVQKYKKNQSDKITIGKNITFAGNEMQVQLINKPDKEKQGQKSNLGGMIVFICLCFCRIDKTRIHTSLFP